MSIYPVKASKWWAVRKKDPKEMQDDIKLERSCIKALLKSGLKCDRCGKMVTLKDWNKCYISHAFVYGFNDVYCDDKCLSGKG